MARAAGLALAAALAAAPAAAQTRASLDAGASYVEYDGFLPSASFSLTPALRLARGRFAFVARGTWLRFESGNNSFQGLLAGSLLLPASAGIVADLGTEIGGSRYEAYAQFSHLLGRARLQFAGAGDGSGWVAATVGTAASDSGRQSVQGLAAGFRLARRDLTLALTGSGTFTQDNSYADFETMIRHTGLSGFEAEAVVSARAGDPANDAGPYVEATVTIPLAPRVAVVLAGGRYAVDAVRGNIAGRYASAALRLTAPFRPRRTIALATPPDPAAEPAGAATPALVEMRSSRGAARTLVFRIAGASRVEVMADFTDWLPIPLQPVATDLWSITLSVTPGRHRLNLRVNGGAWGVPAGTMPVADDFQGMVGAVVVP